MNRTYSENTESLPRIRSQGKFIRAVTHHTDKQKDEEPLQSEEKRTLTRLNSQRKNIQSANISKAVRYEATNAIYLKKIQTLEKQSFILEKEIASANETISLLRIKKKTTDDSRSVTSKASSQVSKWSKLGGDINLSRFEVLRKKVDKENEKNRATQCEVDKVRKEIMTTKKLNEQLIDDLKAITQRLQAEAKISQKLQEEIVAKRQDVKRKKIEAIHKKTHIIKNYDNILKKLDEDLASNPVNESRATINNNLYLTDVYVGAKEKRKPKNFTENSPKAKRNALQLNHFKEQIEQCEQHFKQLQEATGCGTVEEAIGKFSQEYEQNFSNYRFINERFAHLEELKQKNAELNKSKEDLQQSLQTCMTNRSACQLRNIQGKLEEVKEQKLAAKDKIAKSQALFATLKQFISQAVNKVPLQAVKLKYEIDQFTDFDSLITKQNLQEFLDEILAAKEQHQKKKAKEVSLGRQAANHTLEQCLEHAKKEGLQERERFLGREELMQASRKVGRPKNVRN